MKTDMKKLYMVGASGCGREVLETVEAINKVKSTYEIQGFIDDDASLTGKIINEQKILGTTDYLIEQGKSDPEIYATVAIGDPRIREKIINKIQDFVLFDNIIHPTARISKFAKIGNGNIFQISVNVLPNAEIGNHCVINRMSSVGHDGKLSDFVSVMNFCDITGNVKLGVGAYLGSSVAIHPGKTIGAYAKVGMGSVVISNVEEGTVVIGNPARAIK
jgi:sugar O-acyltransferase (sialic acid O-acetyltransferase NeuD family)